MQTIPRRRAVPIANSGFYWPVPVRATVCGLAALITRVAERSPVALGVKATLTAQPERGWIVSTQFVVREKSPAFGPCTEIELLRIAVPMLVMVTGTKALRVPTATVPKLMLGTESVTSVLGVGR